MSVVLKTRAAHTALKPRCTFRINFPAELQFGAIIRFLVDATQTPNVKVKLAALCYLAQLANAMDPTAIAGGGRDTKPALTKIITWTGDPKSAEIRRASGAALNALFNLNVPAVTMMLSDMPSEYQVTSRSLSENFEDFDRGLFGRRT